MKFKLCTATALWGIVFSIASGTVFGRDDGRNQPRNNNRPGHVNGVSQWGNSGNQGGTNRALPNQAVQNQIRNQVQARQNSVQPRVQNPPQFRPNLPQQNHQVQRPNLVQQQQFNQQKNLINQQLNHAHQQVQQRPNQLQNQLNQTQLQNRANQAQHQFQQNQQLNQRLNQLNQQHLQNSNQQALRRDLGGRLPSQPGQHPGITNHHETLKPNLNQNLGQQNSNRNPLHQHPNQNQSHRDSLNQKFNPQLNHPNQNLNPNLNAGRLPNRGPQNSSIHNHDRHSNRPGLTNLNQNQLNQIRHHQHLQNTVGLNSLAHHKHKVVGGQGFTPLYASGHHHHHHLGDGHQHVGANHMRFGNQQIYLSRANYAPSYYRHPHWYKGYWNLNYGNNLAGYGLSGGYPYRSYAYLPYFWGLGGWGLGSMAYGCGYTHYYNPYYVVQPTTVVYDYSEPIPVAYNTQIANVDQNPIDQNAGSTTDQVLGPAVAAFKLNNYDQALDIVNQGIRQNSDDAVLHEFRSLVLFARGDYQQAAATVHSILAVGPGWNWTTLSGMYADTSVYTAQLRALETAVKANPNDAASRFLLAYHYLSDGYPDAAATQLEKVVSLVPNDEVAVNLLKMLKPGNAPTAPLNSTTPLNNEAQPLPQPNIDLPAPDPVDPVTAIDPEEIEGEWNASRDDGSFELVLTAAKTFTWTYTPKNKPPQSFEGNFTLEGNVIALEREGGGSMVGEISDNDENSFNFRMVGAPEEDLGLDFTR